MSDNLKFHEAANIFPLMFDAEFDALKADIASQGVQLPIELLDGLIIDGRNRYRACVELGKKCPSVVVRCDDPVAYVLSRNLHRRHLTPSQLAMVGDKARALFDKLAKERQKARKGNQPGATPETLPELRKGDARDAAGKAVGVSGKLIDSAAKVRKEGVPELAKAVEEGRISVSMAAKLADADSDTQNKVASAAKFSGGRYRLPKKQKADENIEPGKLRGVGVLRANEAVDALKRIPKNDALRKRGFQIVTDWIKVNK
jgi:ParB-like chromosome segregation protein Spo0J